MASLRWRGLNGFVSRNSSDGASAHATIRAKWSRTLTLATSAQSWPSSRSFPARALVWARRASMTGSGSPNRSWHPPGPGLLHAQQRTDESNTLSRRDAHEHDYREGWHDALLQRLGQGSGGDLLSWVAAERRRLGRPIAVPHAEGLPRGG